MIVSLDADILDISDDYYTALSDALEMVGDRHYVELSPQIQLYLFEYYKINKVGGDNIPYACMHWPGIPIPQAIINLLDTKDLLVNFIDDNLWRSLVQAWVLLQRAKRGPSFS